jgi:subtilisin-like proprotein convertase family protein
MSLLKSLIRVASLTLLVTLLGTWSAQVGAKSPGLVWILTPTASTSSEPPAATKPRSAQLPLLTDDVIGNVGDQAMSEVVKENNLVLLNAGRIDTSTSEARELLSLKPNAESFEEQMAVIEGGTLSITAESCAPPDNAIEPDETVTVDLPLSNVGTSDTTNLVATLQATGGVTSPSGPQTYGMVVAGGAEVTRSFTFTASPGLLCGSNIVLTLQLQDGASDLGTVTFTQRLGTLGAPSTAQYSSGNIAVPISDNASVEVPIAIGALGAVSDVNVRVRLNHTFDQDVVIELISPSGTTVSLAANRDTALGGGDNYGTGPNNCSGTPTIFDDAAATQIGSGLPPFAGTFRPETPLSVLNGEPINGTWKLRVTDTATLDTGTIGCVTLEVVRQPYVCCGIAGTPIITSGGAPTITAESITPANNAPDPGETLTATFPVINTGDGPTTNLVGTIQTSGGITPVSGGVNYGIVTPGGGAVARPFTFVASGTCGDTVTVSIHYQDGALDLGTITYTFQLGTSISATSTFSNTTSITIPSSGTGATTGSPANPYPSNVTVAGLVDPVTKVTVTLKNMSHTFPDDVDVLLVGPTGAKMIVISDAGDTNDWVGATVTLDDAAVTALADTGNNQSGTYRPGNFGTVQDPFPAPAPAGPHLSPAPGGTATFASSFNGLDPNGTWSLYVVDDAATDVGSFAGGWDLTITTTASVCNSQSCSLVCPANITMPSDLSGTGATANFAATPTGACGVLGYSTPSGAFFPIGTTAVTATGTDGAMCSFNVTVTPLDVTPPGVEISAAAPDPTNMSPIPVTVTFSEAVTGFDAGDLAVGNGTAGNFSGSGAVYTFDLTPSGPGAVTVNIAPGVAQDGAGNGNTSAAPFSRTFDNVPPTVSLSSAVPDPTNASPIPVTVTFSEAVTGFDAGDLTVGNGTAGNFSGSGAVYTFDLTPGGPGVVTADIAGGVAQDAAGNGNDAAPPFSRTFESSGAPAITITEGGDPTATSAFLKVAGSVSDDGQVDRVTWSSSFGAHGEAMVQTVPPAGSEAGVDTMWQGTWSAVVPLRRGVNTLTFTAVDDTGEETAHVVAITVSEYRYYLAEGTKGPFFDTYLLLANPMTETAPVTLTFLPEGGGAPIVWSGSVAPQTRVTVPVDAVPGLESAAFSTIVTSTNAVPIAVERSMYWGDGLAGGHAAAALEQAARTWYLAEGSEQDLQPGVNFFDTYLLLGNPNAVPATVTVRFTPEQVPSFTREFDVPAQSRFTVSTALIPELANQAFGLVVTSDVPVFAARSQYFGPGYAGGESSEGTVDPSRRWLFAEGSTQGSFETYLLLANPSAAPVNLTVTYRLEDGTPIVTSKVLAGNSRLTIAVANEDPQLQQAAFWIQIDAEEPIFAERSMFWPTPADQWGAGHASPGARDAATSWVLAEGVVGQAVGFETYLLLANPTDAPADVQLRFMREDGTFVDKQVTVNAFQRSTIFVNDVVPEVAGQAFGVAITSTSGVPIVVERSVYWNQLGAGSNAGGIRIP